MGCYWDGGGKGQPDFRAIPTLTQGNVKSASECADRARGAGKPYYGLQAGGQCFVGDDLPRAIKFGQAPGTCAALGSGWVNNVYDLTDSSLPPLAVSRAHNAYKRTNSSAATPTPANARNQPI